MIQLDTNYLIGAVTTNSPIEQQVLAWFTAGETFSTSAVAWSEFMSGPFKANQLQTALTIVESRIVPFGTLEAELAARLFNAGGRKRGSRPDCFVASTAICARVPLATNNAKDFVAFLPFGLRLA